MLHAVSPAGLAYSLTARSRSSRRYLWPTFRSLQLFAQRTIVARLTPPNNSRASWPVKRIDSVMFDMPDPRWNGGRLIHVKRRAIRHIACCAKRRWLPPCFEMHKDNIEIEDQLAREKFKIYQNNSNRYLILSWSLLFFRRTSTPFLCSSR